MHRTTLASKTKNYGRAAEAIAEMNAPEAMVAQLRLTWDDHLVLRVNSAAPIDMGRHQHFRSRTVNVPLHKGTNTVSVVLNNEIGTNFGGWAFAFRAISPTGETLVPHAPRR